MTSWNVLPKIGRSEHMRIIAWRNCSTTLSTCRTCQQGRHCASYRRQRKGLIPFETSRTGTSRSSTSSIVWRQVKPCRTWMSPRAPGSSSRSGIASLCGPEVRRSCVRSRCITIASTTSVVSSRPGQPTFLLLGSSGQSSDPLFPRRLG